MMSFLTANLADLLIGLILLLFKATNLSFNLKKNEKIYINNIFSNTNYLNLNKFF